MKERSGQLVTERLVLKQLEEGDRESLLRIVSDSRVKRTYMLPDFENQEKADAFFRRMRELSAAPERFVYGVFLNGELIGFLNETETEGTSVEVGYFIAPECWNRGYATEALQAAVAELFRMGFECVTAGYFVGNIASRRVMEKCGMHPLEKETEVEYRGAVRRCRFLSIGKPA